MLLVSVTDTNTMVNVTDSVLYSHNWQDMIIYKLLQVNTANKYVCAYVHVCTQVLNNKTYREKKSVMQIARNRLGAVKFPEKRQPWAREQTYLGYYRMKKRTEKVGWWAATGHSGLKGKAKTTFYSNCNRKRQRHPISQEAMVLDTHEKLLQL